jgi:cyclic-di-GMP phosphodiesterase TipF (flagellum assembly factor)
MIDFKIIGRFVPEWGAVSMIFLGQTVIIIAMALVALSLGGISYLLLGLRLETALLLSIAGFACMVILQMATWRTRDNRRTNRDLQDLGSALETVTRDIAVLNNKVAAYEQAGVIRAAQDVVSIRAAMQALQEEMDQVTSTLHQHYELIQAARNPVSFGQKRAQPERFEPVAPPEPQARRRGRLSHLDDAAATQLIAKNIDEGRIEIMLQPIVTLPQRKIHSYEILSRIKTEDGDTLLPEDFLDYLQQGTLGTTFDTLVLYRAVQLVRRMQTRNKEIGVTVNLCAATLGGGEEFKPLLDFLAANRALSSSLTLEISQAAYRELGPLEFESMHAISQLGFRFSLDQVRDLRLDAKGLADRGFRCVKVPAEVLLGRSYELPSDLHPADLSSLLSRYGITLIVDRIESEAVVIDLLDYEITYAQGFLFAPPRPVKAEVLAEDGGFADTKAALSA